MGPRDHVRCGTQNCNLRFPLPDISQSQIEKCYAAFRQHCVEKHGLDSTDDTDSRMFLDLTVCTVTLPERPTALARTHRSNTFSGTQDSPKFNSECEP